jgi:Domain of unknown function (DUF5010)
MTKRPAAAFLLLSALASTGARAQETARTIPPAPGRHVGLTPGDFAGATTFRADQRLVMTYYFYWYDDRTKAHLLNSDGTDALTTHPASMTDFSYNSVAWHKRQFTDMTAAGIDVALPVYWGAPSEHNPGAPMHWSIAGLGPMVQAAEELEREGKRPPKIGLFYDTSTLQHNAWHLHIDLTTEFGRRWFYASIRDFFSMVPPRHWAMIDGKPIVSLYAASFAKAHDQRCIDEVKAQFRKDFGGREPYVIREASWLVRSDSVYAWGGALQPQMLRVAEIGPGYDHSNVPGRTRLVVDREGGAFYERAWRKVLRRMPTIVALETWNEFHEGTDIADSHESGRRYIELTRKYVDLFKAGRGPTTVTGQYTGATRVEVSLGERDREQGLRRVEAADGLTTPLKVKGLDARATLPPQAGRGRYVYFAIDDSFKRPAPMDVTVEVEYLDRGEGRFSVDYDSCDLSAWLDGAYKRSPTSVTLTGSETLKRATFSLTDARFANSQNADADFRIAVEAPGLVLGRVAVTHKPSAAPTP